MPASLAQPAEGGPRDGGGAPVGGWGRIGYLGPAGTFSEEALLRETDLAAGELVAYPSIGAAVAGAGAGEVDAAFVPLENTIEGSINATLDPLVFDGGLLVQREVVFDVHLDLLALPGAPRSGVRRVVSYSAALGQVREYLKAELPDAEQLVVGSTAEAARRVAAEADPAAAAVAPPGAAARYGLEPLASSIEDRAGNQTRFVLVAPGVVPPPSGQDRTLLVCFQPSDRPGSLQEILGQFAARSLNLTRIESRPTREALGDYCFVIEVEGHVGEDLLGDCLVALRSRLEEVRFLGSYPVSGALASRRRAEAEARGTAARAWLEGVRSRISPPA